MAIQTVTTGLNHQFVEQNDEYVFTNVPKTICNFDIEVKINGAISIGSKLTDRFGGWLEREKIECRHYFGATGTGISVAFKNKDDAVYFRLKWL